MKFEKFKSILDYNISHMEQTSEYIKQFYQKMGMDCDKEILNRMQLVRTQLRKLGYILMEIPMKDKEIGAFCYKGSAKGYVILNSSLPRANIHFALCHELYHIYFQQRPLKHTIELYVNEHYFEDQEEFAANAFAGALLMPENDFTKMYYRFLQEKSPEDSEVFVLANLMSYYGAPYMAVLIRCYELKLMQDGERLRDLLSVQNEDIRSEFIKYWLNDALLLPTYRDDYSKLETLVRTVGEQMQQESVMRAKDVETAMRNMGNIYNKIREK